MSTRFQIGNAQEIGRREIQSNYFSTAFINKTDLIAIVADGSIDHPNGRKAAILAVEYCVNAFQTLNPSNIVDISDVADTADIANIANSEIFNFMLWIAKETDKRIREVVYKGRTPRLSLTMIYISNTKDNTKTNTENNTKANYFNIGTNKIYLYNGHNERVLNYDSNRPYTIGTHEFKRGEKETIAILTKGAYTHMHPMERIRIMNTKRRGDIGYNIKNIENNKKDTKNNAKNNTGTKTRTSIDRIISSRKRLTTFDKAQAIIEAVATKNLPNQQNATVVLIETY